MTSHCRVNFARLVMRSFYRVHHDREIYPFANVVLSRVLYLVLALLPCTVVVPAHRLYLCLFKIYLCVGKGINV